MTDTATLQYILTWLGFFAIAVEIFVLIKRENYALATVLAFSTAFSGLALFIEKHDLAEPDKIEAAVEEIKQTGHEIVYEDDEIIIIKVETGGAIVVNKSELNAGSLEAE